MREISTKPIEVGEHVMIDGIEYVAEKADLESPCKGCAFENGSKPCPDFIECDGIVFGKVKKEPKYRPYKDTDEMIADFKERFKPKDWPSYSMPLIWVRLKSATNATYFVYGYLPNGVAIGVARPSFHVLLEDYTYLDGSTCGKEVSE